MPKSPAKLKVKQSSPTIFKVSWEAPKDNGGAEVLLYSLQLAEYSESVFKVIFEGPQLEYTLDAQEMNLKPGSGYKLRVSCSNLIGSSVVRILS